MAIGWVERDTQLGERWIGRNVKHLAPVEYRTQYTTLTHVATGTFATTPPTKTTALHKKARIQFEESDKWYWARHVFVEPKEGEPQVPLLRSLRTLSHEYWWVGEGNVLERRATIYEARTTKIPPPNPSWQLVHASKIAAWIGLVKSTPGKHFSKSSETEQGMRRKERLQRRARLLKKAQATLEVHKKALRRKQELIAQWEKRVADLRRPDVDVLAERSSQDHKPTDGRDS